MDKKQDKKKDKQRDEESSTRVSFPSTLDICVVGAGEHKSFQQE